MSGALDQLQIGLQELDDLEALVQLKTKGSKGPTAGILAARRASVLLLNAHFEAYLEDVLEESLKTLNSGCLSPRFGETSPLRAYETSTSCSFCSESRRSPRRLAGNEHPTSPFAARSTIYRTRGMLLRTARRTPSNEGRPDPVPQIRAWDLEGYRRDRRGAYRVNDRH